MARDNVENLRKILISSTEDPKFRYAVQVYITWMIVLMRKQMAFFSEDFSRPIHEIIPTEFRDCVVFAPECLFWADIPELEILFMDFVRSAEMKTPHVQEAYGGAKSAYNNILDALMVRYPPSKTMLTRLAVQGFLFMIPIFNMDLVTRVVTPLVACIFIAILQLSNELADPWGSDFHDLPVLEVMQLLCAPVWFEGRSTFRECARVVQQWFNREQLVSPRYRFRRRAKERHP